MNLKEKIKKFDKRWSVISDESAEESFNKFKIRALNVLKGINSRITRDGISEFCQFYGIDEVWQGGDYGGDSYNKNIENKLNSENNPIEFYKLLEVIFTLEIKESHSMYGTYSKKTLINDLEKAINYSNINARILKRKNEIIFYPAGEEKLDEEIVEYSLSFLNDKSGNHFEDALKFYEDKKYVKSAESLRRTIEEFLREILNNKKGLDVNIKEIGKELKGDADAQVRNIIFQIFKYLDEYFNINSKHNDGEIDETENEFLIYQVGLLMRYISRVIER